MSNPDVVQELKALLAQRGRLTFAEFQQVCLYSANGGFYSGRSGVINAHFSTSPTTHPVFGTLIARQLQQMWQLMGRPARFQVIEVGSGDGSLARSIVRTSAGEAPDFAQALEYVAADYEPWWPPASGIPGDPADTVQRVKAQGLRGFHGVTGCILSNELLDNFPVHRFAIEGGRVREVFVTSAGDGFAEVLDDPLTPAMEERLSSLGLSLPDGTKGELNLGLEGWVEQLDQTLERGFVLTIDYGELAADLYSEQHRQGTLICFSDHSAGNDPYADIGEQDITSFVDFTSLMRLGESRGFASLGFGPQQHFLNKLGFEDYLAQLATRDVPSEAHRELERLAMNSLVDPEDLGEIKVLAQAKGMGSDLQLRGFSA